MVERQASALLALDEEVSQRFDRLFVEDLVLDMQNRLVEELSRVSSHLRWLLQFDANCLEQDKRVANLVEVKSPLGKSNK